jgi:hypothetical protein
VPTDERAEFSAAEMRRRRAAFGRELERHDTAYALVYGANRSGSAVSWLTEGQLGHVAARKATMRYGS